MDQDDLITRLIKEATKFVERRTRRALTNASAARLFDGNDKGYLIVDDFQSCTAVVLLNVDDTVWKTFDTSDELRFFPYNTVPKFKIVIVNVTSENPYRIIGRSPYIFPKGIANVRVTATWGSYAAVPDDLEGLGIDLVISKMNRAKMRGLSSVSIGGESMSFSDRDLDEGMRDTLSQFKREYTDVW